MLLKELERLAEESKDAGDLYVAGILYVLMGAIESEELGHLERLCRTCIQLAHEFISDINRG